MYACTLKKDIETFSDANRRGKRQKNGKFKADTYICGGSPLYGAWTEIYQPRRCWVKTGKLPKDYKPEVIIEPTPEPGEPKTWYFVKHQWQRNDAADYHDRKNLPLVFRMGEYDNPKNLFAVKLTRELQFFWLDLVCLVLYNEHYRSLNGEKIQYAIRKTTALMTSKLAFCNGHGADIYRNYLTGENADAEDPTMYTIICDGASLQGVEVGKMLAVYHFDPDNLPADVNPFTDPRVFWATTGSDYHVNPFPQLDGKDVPVPIFCNSELYFPLVDLEKYVSPSKRKSYYP